MNIKSLLGGIVALLAMAAPAAAQSACGYIIDGRVLTATQWNFCFTKKQDALGFTPLNQAGGSMGGKLWTVSSSSTQAGFALRPGAAPTSPSDGDVWLTSVGVYARVNGVTVGPLSAVQAYAKVTHQWIDSISLPTGAITSSQPAFSDISGSVAASQMPALTGDVTSSAGTVATAIASGVVSNAKLATAGAYTLKGNFTGSTAAPTDTSVGSLTQKGTPTGSDLLIVQDQAASGSIKYATVTSVLASGTVSAAYPTGYLQGFSLVSFSGNTVTIKAGNARSDDNTVNVSLAANISKNFGSAFVQGSGNGGQGIALPTSGNYYLFAITKNADGSVDVYGDTSISAANVPSGWTARTLLMGLRTDGSANLRPMVQVGDFFEYAATPPLDINATSIPTTAVLRTLTVPAGIKLRVQLQVYIGFSSGIGNASTYFSDPDATDVDPATSAAYTIGDSANNTIGNLVSQVNVMTNASSQIRTRSPYTAADISVGLSSLTLGWTHLRGRQP